MGSFSEEAKTLLDVINKDPKYDALPHDKVLELIKLAQNGDISARNRIIETHTKFVAKVALNVHFKKQKHANGKNISTFGDIFADGCEGLVIAIDKFSFDHDVKFLTYAGWWVKQRIQEQFIDGDFHTPRAMLNEISRFARAKKIYEEWYGRPFGGDYEAMLDIYRNEMPTLKYNGQAAYTVERLAGVARYNGIANSVKSIESEFNSHEYEYTLDDVMEDEDSDISESFSNSEVFKRFRAVGEKVLTRAQLSILMRREVHNETLEQIAVSENCTRENVRQICSRSMEKVKSFWDADLDCLPDEALPKYRKNPKTRKARKVDIIPKRQRSPKKQYAPEFKPTSASVLPKPMEVVLVDNGNGGKRFEEKSFLEIVAEKAANESKEVQNAVAPVEVLNVPNVSDIEDKPADGDFFKVNDSYLTQNAYGPLNLTTIRLWPEECAKLTYAFGHGFIISMFTWMKSKSPKTRWTVAEFAKSPFKLSTGEAERFFSAIQLLLVKNFKVDMCYYSKIIPPRFMRGCTGFDLVPGSFDIKLTDNLDEFQARAAICGLLIRSNVMSRQAFSVPAKQVNDLRSKVIGVLNGLVLH